jgi:hypothetical protein
MKINLSSSRPARRLGFQTLACPWPALLAVELLAFCPLLQAQTTIVSEGFERRFPGEWSVGDGNSAGRSAYWKNVSAGFGGEGAHGGEWKAYCAGQGYAGEDVNPSYQDDMSAYLSRPLDLTGYLSATLTFWHKIPSIESGADRARVIIGGIDSVEVWSSDAPVTEWTLVTIDLAAYVGSSRPLTFQFDSDSSTTAEGWYLDDIAVTGIAQPPNDDCEHALALEDDVPYTMDTAGATADSRTPACQANFGKGVWFTYTPPANGAVVVSTCGSSFDTVLQVYAGPLCRIMTEVPGACNDDDGPVCSGKEASLLFTASANTAYQILAGGYGGASGSLRIEVDFFTAPQITQPPADVTGECGANATFEVQATGEPPLWFQWEKNGAPIENATTSALVVSNVTLADDGSAYRVVVANVVGSVTSAAAILSVRDSTPPSVICPGDIVTDADPDQCSRSNVTFLATTTDNCSGVTVSCDPPSGSTFPKGVTLVTCVATDASGNASRCSFNVTVRDREPPQITCPSNLTAQCASGVPPRPTTLAQFLEQGGLASDRCDVELSYTATDSPLIDGACGGTIRRTHTVTDDAGHSASCVQTITVHDTIPPSLTCPSDIAVQCLAGVPPRPTTLAQFLEQGGLASDNCDTDLTYTASDGPLVGGPCGGTIRRTHTVTDDCANSASCVQTITVRDTVPPSITCPSEVAVQCLAAVPPLPTTLAQFLEQGGLASDNCDADLTYSSSDGPLVGGACGGTLRRTHTVTDDCANSASCVQIITVRDTIPPSLTCPSDIAVQCLAGVPPRPTTLTQFLEQGGLASDNCDADLTYSSSDGPLVGGPCGGTLRRTHTVTDDCANSASCVQIITVRDTVPPVLTCAPDKTVSLDSAWAFEPPTATDACSGTEVNLVVVSTVTNSLAGCGFTAVRTWRATDACGNVAECSQTVSVLNTTPLTMTCPPDIVADSDPGQCSRRNVTFVATATDDCPGVTVTCTPPSGSTFSIGVTLVTCVATDAAGNTSMCSFSVTIRDTEPPQVNCPENLLVETETEEARVVFDTTARDNCDRAPIVNCVPASGTVLRLGSHTVECTATDASGNSSTCQFTITLRKSDRPPVITTQPASATVLAGQSVRFQVVADGTPPLAYQWLFNGQAMSDATAPDYVIERTLPSHAGEYAVRVSNAFGALTSQPAVLTVQAATKEDRVASEAIQTALGAPVYRELKTALESQGYRAQPWQAQVQWGFDYRKRDPYPVCQIVTVAFQSPAGSNLRGMVGVLLGIGETEDGRVIKTPRLLGAVALLADPQGEQRTVLRMLCDAEGMCRPLEVMDDECLAAWFGPKETFPNRPPYAAVIADLVQSADACSALAGTSAGEASRTCRRFARAMGLYTFCVLGICLPPDFQAAPQVLTTDAADAARREAAQVEPTPPPSLQASAASSIPEVPGTDTCCRWLQDLINTGVIGESVFGAGPLLTGDVVGGAVGALIGGLAALFVLNDDESEWCLCRGPQDRYAVLEGIVSQPGWQGGAGDLPVFFPSQDNPLTHDTLDLNLDVVAFSAGQAWSGSPDYTRLAGHLNAGLGTVLECEWESSFLPCFAWPWPGDQVWLRGQLIYDCGHGKSGTLPDGRTIVGFSSEIHPPHALVTMRLEGAVLSEQGLVMPARVARVFISPWAGEANHPDDINGDGFVWTSGAGGAPRFDVNNTPYQFKVPLPPKSFLCDYTTSSEPALLVRIEPEASLALASTYHVDSADVRWTHQLANHAYLQSVLDGMVLSPWPNPTKPTHVEVKIPLTAGPIPDLGGGISPIQIKIAVGWNDAPLALRLSAPMPVLDEEGDLEIAASDSPLVVSTSHPLPGGRTLVPPDRRTRLKVTGPDCAWLVRPVRVDFAQVLVGEDHDWHSDGEFQLFVGANGQWRRLPLIEGVDDGDQQPIALNAPVHAQVWNSPQPRLEVSVLGFEEDQMVWGLDWDDDLGRVFARHGGNLGIGQPPFRQLSTHGDFVVDYQVLDAEGACAADTFDPANDQSDTAVSITGPGTRSHSGLRVAPRDTADWFALDTDDYMTLTATLSDQTPQSGSRCRNYNLQVITERAVILPDQFDDGTVVNVPCSGGGTMQIEEFAGRNEDWASSPILRLCPSPFTVSDYDGEVHPLLNDINPDGLVVENLSFHLPYPGLDATPDRDFYRIQILSGLQEQCGAPCPKELHGKFNPTALTILIQGDRDRPMLVTVTNFTSGFSLDNDPATPTPDTATSGGHTLKISWAGTTTTIQLECPRGSSLFPDGQVGLALRDPEGKRNFYDLFASYNVWAFCDVDRLLQSPGLKELILGKLWGNRDPVPVRFIPFVGFADPRGNAFARVQAMPFVDQPAEGGALPTEDRWLVLLPRGNATIDIVVTPPPGVERFDVGMALHDLLDRPLVLAQEVGASGGLASAAALASERTSAAAQAPVPRRYRLQADDVGGSVCYLKVTRPQAGGTFLISATITRTPDVAVSPASVSFGNRCLGLPTAPQLVTVRNEGTAALTVSNLSLAGDRPGDFALSDVPTLPVIVPAGSSVSFGVTYRPALAGTSTAEIVIRSDDADENPVRVSLSGVALAGDTEPPRLKCAADLTVWTCTDGAAVEYQVSADDDCTANVNVVSLPPSGSVFPLGTSSVTCTATDAGGQSSQCQFTVRVLKDAEPPQITCPTNRTAALMNTDGAIVFFNVEAQDNAGGSVPVTCTPPSGSWFPPGQTTVICQAEDACGNRAQCSFPVIVGELPPPKLSIARQGNRILVTWPTVAAAYTLETTASLEAPVSWAPAGLTPEPTADGYAVSIEVGELTRFYRLRRP